MTAPDGAAAEPPRQAAATAAAVLFDLDGVLVDSEPVWYAVEGAVVERLGGTWSRAHQAQCIGGTVDATSRYIVELTGTDVELSEVQAEVMRGMVAHYTSDLPVMPGALALVDAVRAAGVPTALVSSSYRVLVDAALVRLGAHRFDATVAGDEVHRGKPDPEPYLTACARLGVAAADAVVVEDAMNGVLAAERAGCVVVVAPTVAAVEPAPRRHVVDGVDAIDPQWLLGLPATPS